MKRFLRRAKTTGVIFAKGFAKQIEGSMWLACGVGLYQGLKYGGSLARGVKAGIAVLGAFGTANGVSNILANRDAINRS